MQDRSPSNPSGRPEREASDIAHGLARLAQPDVDHSRHLGARLRNYLLTGLVIVGPVTITLYIAWSFIKFVDAWVKPYIPTRYNPETYAPFAIPGLGLLVAIVGLIVIGALAANLIGRSLISAGELMLGRMPIVRNVYRALKQIFESVVTATGPEQAFQKVALMEFPSQGILSLVFITGSANEEIARVRPDEELVSVFMPTHLLPPSGFLVFVPRRCLTPIDMSFEDAAKIILSAGMVNDATQARLRSLAVRPPVSVPVTAPQP